MLQTRLGVFRSVSQGSGCAASWEAVEPSSGNVLCRPDRGETRHSKWRVVVWPELQVRRTDQAIRAVPGCEELREAERLGWSIHSGDGFTGAKKFRLLWVIARVWDEITPLGRNRNQRLSCCWPLAGAAKQVVEEWNSCGDRLQRRKTS